MGTYKGGIGYMPVIGSIAELGIIIADEFRDGNIAPAFEVERFFKQCEKALPKSVKHIRTRLDGAYYNHDFMDYLEKREIEYTITAEKRAGLMRWIKALPDEAWKPLMKITDRGLVPTGREWTEIDWVSANGTRTTMKEHTKRYLVTRKVHHQWEIFQDTVYRIKPRTRVAAACIAGRVFKLSAEEAEAVVVLHSRKSD